MTVIVFGSANVDLVMPVSTFPMPGETVLITWFQGARVPIKRWR